MAQSESEFIKSINKYRLALRRALEIVENPSKAPEEIAETTLAVILVALSVQVEFAAMNLASYRTRKVKND